jgi:hypothetical protein
MLGFCCQQDCWRTRTAQPKAVPQCDSSHGFETEISSDLLSSNNNHAPILQWHASLSDANALQALYFVEVLQLPHHAMVQ